MEAGWRVSEAPEPVRIWPRSTCLTQAVTPGSPGMWQRDPRPGLPQRCQLSLSKQGAVIPGRGPDPEARGRGPSSSHVVPEQWGRRQSF